MYDPICALIPENATLQGWTVRRRTRALNRILTFHNVFSKKHMRVVLLVTTQDATSRGEAQVLFMSSFLFIRHYLGNPLWFFFLHLLICLNSVGNCVRDRVKS